VAVLLAVIALALSACGVPSGGKPIVDVNQISTSDQGGTDGPPAVSPPDGFIGRPTNFIEDGYLTALASQVGPSVQTKAVRSYMAQDVHWTPPPAASDKTATLPVTLVRPVRQPQAKLNPLTGGTTVTFAVQRVGVFDPDSGQVTNPDPSTREITLTFELSSSGVGPTYQITSAPPGFYMLSAALSDTSRYVPQVIYFWNAAGQLVPDLRYLPTWWSPQQKATSIVTWILSDPPTWAKSVVQSALGLADQTITVEQNGPYAGSFVVNLASTSMTSEQETDLLAQIRWSLGLIHADPRKSEFALQPVELEIVNRFVMTDGDSTYLKRNQAAARDESPTAYAIVGGKAQAIGYVSSAPYPGVYVFDKPESSGATKGAFESSDNSSVLYGAVHVNQDGTSNVALVRSINGHQELWVTRGAGAGNVKYARVKLGSLPKSVMFTRPVWLNQAPGEFAIVADGRLYVVDAKNQMTEVPTNGTDITSFSIGPDGYQIAYVAQNQVWTAVLFTAGQPWMTSPTPINLRPDLDSVTSVAWSSIYQLAVGGMCGGTCSGQATVVETNSDGVDRDEPWLNLAYKTPPTQIASYPVTPLSIRNVSSPVMVEESDGAYGGRATVTALWKGKATAPMNPFFAD
jgi:hypothetical protein